MNYLWAILAYLGALILCAVMLGLWLWFYNSSQEQALREMEREKQGREAWHALGESIVKALHIDKLFDWLEPRLEKLSTKRK